MNKSIAGVILAAGLSRRMGRPKMLLPWGDTTVLGQVVNTFSLAGVREIVVVIGGARQAVDSELERLACDIPLRSVFNPQYETGEMLSSLQCGLASLGSQVEIAMIGLGDQPQLSLSAVKAVVAACESVNKQLIVPSYNLHRGHPWLVHRGFWDEILCLKPPQTLRDFLNTHAQDIMYIEADPSILKDLDTPDDYSREKP